MNDYQSLQARINDGSIWLFEGSVGRAAMDALREGLCILGPIRVKDYWGATVPSRFDVKEGTTGSRGLALENHGEEWLAMLEAVK